MHEARMPEFDQDEGGQAARVQRTGIALVHEGELVMPAAGSEAAATLVAHDDRVIVNYYFPVEIEVRSAASPIDVDELVARAFDGIVRGVESVLL